MKKCVIMLLVAMLWLSACQSVPAALPLSAGSASQGTLKEILIPAGPFTMGSDYGFPDEQPVHQVTLEAFYIDTFEVTNARYAECVAAGVCKLPIGPDSVTRSNYYGSAGFGNYPVIAVSWNQANAFCQWRSARLPSEAEWERAARGSKPQSYPWGEGIDQSRANYNSFVGDTSPVGSYESGKSPEGVYDLAGNVSEWVADWYDVYPGGDSRSGSGFGKIYRVMRGGSWQDLADSVCTTARSWDVPDFESYNVGFRCARTP